MMENMIVGVLIVIAVGAGIWVWWMENHGSQPEIRKDTVAEEKKQNGESK